MKALTVARVVVVATIALALLAVFTDFGRALSWPAFFTPVARHFTASTVQTQNTSDDVPTQAAQQWSFDFEKDGNNHGLSEKQCMLAFPLLTKEIDRAVEYRRKVGNITEQDLDIAWRTHGILRVLVRDNRLYIEETLNVERGHRTRYLATLNSINTALSSYNGKLPNTEFTICVQDNCLFGGKANKDRVTFSYSRSAEQESLWLMPDFGFWGWPKVGMPSYSELRTIISDSEPPFADKIPQLVWRGSIVDSEKTRQALVRESKDQPWSAVHALSWGNKEDKERHLISMEDHCDYMFAAMTEGNTWSGRFKLLLNCHSVIISHKLNWLEFYYHLLSDSGPSQNYIQVDRQFGGLHDTMQRLLEPDSGRNESMRIADNARRVFREQYLTPAAISCYWRALLRGWASVQGFEPKIWAEESRDDAGRDEKFPARRKPRGTSFDSYTIMEALEWELPAQPRKLVVNDLVYYE